MDGIFHVPSMAKGKYVSLSLFHKSPVMVALGRQLTESGIEEETSHWAILYGIFLIRLFDV